MQAELDVADVNSHQLMLKKGRPTASLQSMGQDRTATVNDQLTVSCISFGSTQTPNLTIHANGQDINDIYGGNVNTEMVKVSGNRNNAQGLALVGYIDTVSNSMFNRNNNLLIECKAWYGDQMFKKKELSLRKRNTGRRPPSNIGITIDKNSQIQRSGRGKKNRTNLRKIKSE